MSYFLLSLFTFSSLFFNNLNIELKPIFMVGSTVASVDVIVLSTDGNSISERGLCWSSTKMPTIKSEKIKINRSATGKIRSTISGLSEKTTYYIRAYSITSKGVVYSDEVNFTTIAKGHLSYTINKAASPTQVELAAYARLKLAADSAVWYLENYTSAVKHVYINYNPETPTADANSEGWMRFGKNQNTHNLRTMLHEMNHSLGTGTSSWWNNMLSDGKYQGTFANLMLKNIQDSDTAAKVNGDRMHWWPYGLNYDYEVKSSWDFVYNCLLIESMRKDGLTKFSGPMASVQSITESNTAAWDFSKDGYKLVWADEFNKNGKPDPTKWKFENGFVRNEEHQWYQQENAWCENGILVIEGRKENKPNPLYDKDSQQWRNSRKNIEYTSSSINTSGLHAWQYGRFEMRGKIDVSAGLWPAWWTLGVNGEWPSNGEIDIMEYYKGKILANIAIGTAKRYNAEWHGKTKSITELGGKEWASKFHVWRMDWTEKDISLFVDDELMITMPMDKLYNKDSSGTHPFKQPHYMLLDLAMGGLNGGSLGDTRFPNRFEVDYVRVYQK
jgi:beta-glucanase (GH16 family)